MPRPREFNADQALDQAMEVFWTKGYEAASLRDLIEAMGISKSSFYDTFGSKHELFLATIDRYNQTVSSCRLASMIDQAPSPKAGIANAFQSVVETMLEHGDKRGCFVSNCAVEVACHDSAAADRVADGLSNTEDAFYRGVRRAQDMGEIPQAKDARALARYLTSTLNGLLVMGKARPDRRSLQDIVGVALSVLD